MHLDIANVRSVADIGTKNVVQKLIVGAALLEDAELGKGAAHVESDEVERLLPAQSLFVPGPRCLQLVPGSLSEDLVKLRAEVERVGQSQPPDAASHGGREASPPQGLGLLTGGH